MKKSHIPFTLIVAIITIAVTAGFISSNKKIKKISQNGFAVVELFTSEGCSSCPSADETVARLLVKNIEKVYILAFHVDYWNRLGWKDPFSKAEYSERQNEYASKFNLSSVYTPQIVINGSSEFVGSDENKLASTIENSLQEKARQNVTIDAKKGNNSITINYTIEGSNEVILNLALIQPEATIYVKRGENSGRTLHHVNIVRAFKTISAKDKGSETMDLTNDIKNLPLQIIAYTQEKKNFHILGAQQKPVE